MEKFSKQIQAVIFDMDGTLIDTERMGAASWDCAGEEVGLFVSEALKRRMIGRNMRDIRAMVQSELPGEDVESLLSRANHHYHRLVSAGPPPVKPGALELLTWLRDRSVPMALATSSRIAQAEDKLGRCGLRPFFRFMIAGDQIDRGKPDPEIFERAAEGLGVPAAKCAVFEDSAPGIEAARRAGALSLLVPEHHPVDPGMALFADHVFGDLTSAPEFLAPLLAAGP